MKYLTTILILFFAVNVGISQKPKFKKISKEELEKKVCDIDSLAKAEYLYKGCEVDFDYNESRGGFDVIYRFQERIKIYDHSYTDVANYAIEFYKNENKQGREKINSIEAYTFNLENGKVIKEKVAKKNIYEEELNKFYSAKKFAFPAIKSGSVLEIKYELRSPNSFTIDAYDFQKSIPVHIAEYSIGIPEFFNYNANIKGLLGLEVKTDTDGDQIKYSYKVNQGSNRAPVYVTRYDYVEYEKTISEYTIKDVPALSKEPFVYTMDNYKSSISHELLSTQLPQGGLKFYTKTWNDIAQILNESENFQGQLKKNYKQHDAFIQGLEGKTPSEKIEAIYNLVQSEYTWNQYYSISANDGIKKMIKNGTGNIAEINLYLINLLKKAGIKANPFVSRQSSSGFLNISNPSLAQLNYVTALVEIEDKQLYLDATDRNLTINMLPSRALNLKGITIDKNTGIEKEIKNPNHGKINTVYALSINENKLEGTFSHSLEGYSAYQGRSTYSTGEAYMKDMETEKKQFSNINVENYKDKNSKVIIKSDVVADGFIQYVEDNIFVDISIFNEEFKNPFESKTRQFAMFFESTFSNTDMLKLKIPEGYEVTSIPENLNIGTPEKLLVARINFNKMGDEVIMTKKMKLNHDIIIPNYYESVQTLYNNLENLLNEKIVFTKVK